MWLKACVRFRSLKQHTKLSDLNYPGPQTVKEHIIIGKNLFLIRTNNMLEYWLSCLIFSAKKESHIQISLLLFSVSLIFSFRIISFHILDEIRSMHQIIHPWIFEAFDIRSCDAVLLYCLLIWRPGQKFSFSTETPLCISRRVMHS